MSANNPHNARRNIIVAAAIAALSLGPVTAAAQVDGDLRAGLNVDSDVLTLGGGLLLDVSNRGSWFFNPNLEAGLSDRDDQVSLNGDFHYDFATTRSASFYMGAGPTLLMNNGSDDAGLNLLGGFAGRHGEVRPFAQFKGVLADVNQVVLMGGVRF